MTAEEIALAYARKYEGDEAAEWILHHLAEINQKRSESGRLALYWLVAVVVAVVGSVLISSLLWGIAP